MSKVVAKSGLSKAEKVVATAPGLPELHAAAHAPTDPEFNDAVLNGPSMDPAGQDFRDAMDVNGAMSEGGISTVQGIDAELQDQQRQIENDTLEVLEALRALDAGETVKWRITRQGTGDPKMDGFLDTWPTKLITLERIRDLMGGGTYYLKGFRNNKYWVHKTVEIAGEPKMYVKDEAGRMSQANAAGGFDVNSFLMQQANRDRQMRQERQEEIERERREREQQRADEKRDREEREERESKRRTELLAIVAPVVGSIGAAIAGAFSNRGSQMTEIAALMAAMKGPDPITVLTQLKALDRGQDNGMVTKILPMLIDMAGERASGGDTGWLDVVKELAKSAGPTVGALIEASVQRAAQPSPLPSAAPVPPQITGPVSAVAPPLIVVPESVQRRERRSRFANTSPPVERAALLRERGESTAITADVSAPSAGDKSMGLLSLLPHLPWLKGQLAWLLQGAQRGKDPQAYAWVFLEEVPEEIEPQVMLQLLSRGDWFQQICQLEPGWNDAGLYPWLELARQVMVQRLSEAVAAMGVGSYPSGEGSAPRSRPAEPAVNRSAGQSRTRELSHPSGVRIEEVERPQGIPDLTGRLR